MKDLKIKFNKREYGISTYRYWFIVEINERQISFYTFSDLSGYGLDEYGFENPEDFIYIGTAILGNTQYIKDSIKANRK